MGVMISGWSVILHMYMYCMHTIPSKRRAEMRCVLECIWPSTCNVGHSGILISAYLVLEPTAQQQLDSPSSLHVY